MGEPFDILVAGEINADLILTGDVEPTFGQVEKLVDTCSGYLAHPPGMVDIRGVACE